MSDSMASYIGAANIGLNVMDAGFIEVNYAVSSLCGYRKKFTYGINMIFTENAKL
jgi:hypothetical protein